MNNEDIVEVDITSQNAIYVDGTRITNRSTKWGTHHTLATFKCQRRHVRENCIDLGYERCVKLIDDKNYLPS